MVSSCLRGTVMLILVSKSDMLLGTVLVDDPKHSGQVNFSKYLTSHGIVIFGWYRHVETCSENRPQAFSLKVLLFWFQPCVIQSNLGFSAECGTVFKDDDTTQIDQYFELNMGPSQVRHVPGVQE